MIVFITWASWVWKTSLTKGLEQKLLGDKRYSFYYFDNIWVPSVKEMEENFWGGEEWQKYATLQWIKKLIKIHSKDRVLVLEWQVNVDFIFNWFKKEDFTHFEVMLIDCSNKEILRRLNEERMQPELANEWMLSWQKFLRKQASEKTLEVIDSSQNNITETIEVLYNKIESYGI